MSDIQVPQDTDAVPDSFFIAPAEMFVCAATDTVHPMYVPITETRHVRVDGQWDYVRMVTLMQNYAEVYDEHAWHRVQVHVGSADRDCDWCCEPIFDSLVEEYALRRMRRHGEYLCYDCRNDAYVCDECNAYVHSDNVYSVNDGDNHFCEGCYDDLPCCDYCDERYVEERSCSCGSGIILNYSDKFHPLLMHSVGANNDLVQCDVRRLPERERNNIFMGLEFEMENMIGHYGTGEIANIFADAYNDSRLMLKHDGSISDGFELVSQPHTLDAFMQHFPWDLVREAQAKGMRGWDVGHREIGIHIHINRKAFYTKPDHTRRNASPHLMGFMYFIYKNVPSIKRIAGRNVQYGHMDEAYLSEAYSICRRGDNQYRRTLGINVHNNDTVELRMFRSTMRVERIQAYLQFVEAAVRYTQTDRINKMRDRFNFRQFATWCSMQERYTQLNNLITEVNAVDYARPLALDADTILPDNSGEFVPCPSDNNN